MSRILSLQQLVGPGLDSLGLANADSNSSAEGCVCSTSSFVACPVCPGGGGGSDFA
jgi:hypothetical protein